MSKVSFIRLFAIVVGLAFPLLANAQQSLPPLVRVPMPQVGAPAKPANPADKPMQVSIVRLDQPGCEPTCVEWIMAQGRIENATPAEFKKVFNKLGKSRLPVLVDSPGGVVDAGLAIGRLIRAKGLDVAVTKTVLAPCDPKDAECRKLKAKGILLGKPEARISRCASSCAFVLAGGVRRYVGPWTVVGVHEIKSTSTLRQYRQHFRIERRYSWGVPVETRKTLLREETLSLTKLEGPADEKVYERVRLYFAEMGVAGPIMALFRSAPHNGIKWLRLPDMQSTNIATDFINGEQVLTQRVASAPPAVGTVVGPGTVIGTAAKPIEARCNSLGGVSLPCPAGLALDNKQTLPANPFSQPSAQPYGTAAQPSPTTRPPAAVPASVKPAAPATESSAVAAIPATAAPSQDSRQSSPAPPAALEPPAAPATVTKAAQKTAPKPAVPKPVPKRIERPEPFKFE